MALGLGLWAIGWACHRFARKFILESGPEARRRDPRRPILFLRAFRDERSVLGIGFSEFENRITGCLKMYGPVITLPKPGQGVPPAGAAREELGRDVPWTEAIGRLLDESSLVAVCLGRGVGLGWEIEEIARREKLWKTLFLFPPSGWRSRMKDWETFLDSMERQGYAVYLPKRYNLRKAFGFVTDRNGRLTMVHTRSSTFEYRTVISELVESIGKA
jgi:hypothetical protein